VATITCPNCGAESSGEERCPGCSLPLMVSCPDCGTENAADDEVCAACGTSLAHATADGGV
jgi:predicted nucleic-acid-binding Zn-ribbon protein